jgi:hypothetical protein
VNLTTNCFFSTLKPSRCYWDKIMEIYIMDTDVFILGGRGVMIDMKCCTWIEYHIIFLAEKFKMSFDPDVI